MHSRGCKANSTFAMELKISALLTRASVSFWPWLSPIDNDSLSPMVLKEQGKANSVYD